MDTSKSDEILKRVNIVSTWENKEVTDFYFKINRERFKQDIQALRDLNEASEHEDEAIFKWIKSMMNNLICARDISPSNGSWDCSHIIEINLMIMAMQVEIYNLKSHAYSPSPTLGSYLCRSAKKEPHELGCFQIICTRLIKAPDWSYCSIN